MTAWGLVGSPDRQVRADARRNVDTLLQTRHGGIHNLRSGRSGPRDRREGRRRCRDCLPPLSAALRPHRGGLPAVKSMPARTPRRFWLRSMSPARRWRDGCSDMRRSSQPNVGSPRPCTREIPRSTTCRVYFDRRLRPALRTLLEAAVASGEVRADVDADDLLGAVASLCMSAPQYRTRPCGAHGRPARRRAALWRESVGEYVFLECDPEKWIPVRVKKTRQNKRLSFGSDSIRPDLAPVVESNSWCPRLTGQNKRQRSNLLTPSPAAAAPGSEAPARSRC